jgi:putative flippase GtrA
MICDEEEITGGGAYVKTTIHFSFLDRPGRGHIVEMMRVTVFLTIGASVALLNLMCVWLLSHQHRIPYILYVTAATEFSILCSFFLNDRITFRRLAAGSHIWYIRCMRFHAAAAAGAIVTIVISTVLYHLLGFRPVMAQSVAILIATVINFSMHRFWTYRPSRSALPVSSYVDVGEVSDHAGYGDAAAITMRGGDFPVEVVAVRERG